MVLHPLNIAAALELLAHLEENEEPDEYQTALKEAAKALRVRHS